MLVITTILNLFTFAYNKIYVAVIMLFQDSSQADADLMTQHGLDTEHSFLDYAIIVGGIIIVILTLIYSIKFLVKPNEDNPEHIKNIVKDEGF